MGDVHSSSDYSHSIFSCTQIHICSTARISALRPKPSDLTLLTIVPANAEQLAQLTILVSLRVFDEIASEFLFGSKFGPRFEAAGKYRIIEVILKCHI
jgi:hypothetical protein